jgi:hypothetical protein
LAWRAKSFVLLGDGKELYHRSPSGILQRCISITEGQELLQEIHSGACGHHAAPRALVGNAFRQGFYWPTAVADATRIRDENGRERSGKYLYRFHFHIYLAGRKRKRDISVTKTNGINTGIEKRYDPVGLKPKSDGNRYFCSVNQHHETIYSKLNNK